MSWQEFSYLLQGLSGDTPLGRIASIRAETDPEVIKNMSNSEKRIRSKYRKKIANKRTEKENADFAEHMKQALLKMAR